MAGFVFPYKDIDVTVSGTTAVTIRNPMKYEKWEGSQQIGSSGWTEVWSCPELLFGGVFYEAVWHLNSDKINIRIKLGGVVVLELDLWELSRDYKLQQGQGHEVIFSLRSYANNRWLFRPPIAQTIGEGQAMVIEMKAHAGNKTVNRGISVWGEL